MEGARPKKIHIPDRSKKDIISLLPEEILHHILCLLSQKEAIRTCVLSKAWRYVGYTRPKIEWTDLKSIAILDIILQACHLRNLHLDEFSLQVGNVASEFLHTWIPLIIQNMRVKTLCLDMSWLKELFELPSLIIESDHIQNLSLEGCAFKSSSEARVYLQRLQTLRLDDVYIPEEILDKILSNCPFLEDVYLEVCEGFKRIKLFVNNNKPTKLAQFCFIDDEDRVSIEIGDGSQTHTSIDSECKPLESAQNRRKLALDSARLLSYSFSCNFTILELYEVYIPKRILDNILSNCPFLEDVSLKVCEGFETIEMLNNSNTNIEHFCFHGDNHRVISIEIGNDVKTLRSIDINQCLLFSVSRNMPLECATLTRLSLTRVQLSSESFSCNLNSLEELKLDQCSGIKEFRLSSQSMKRFEIHNMRTPFKATIDAPSMVSFIYEGNLPEAISFTTTPHEWISNIKLGTHIEPPHCFSELYGLLEALNQSEISLELDQIEIDRFGNQLQIGDDDIVGNVLEEAKHELPVAVEHLTIKRLGSAATFLNMLFHMFRPSFIYLSNSKKKHREIAELLFKKREPAQSCYIWQRALEGVNLQVKYRSSREWQSDEYTSFTEGADGRELEFRIHLKWRD